MKNVVFSSVLIICVLCICFLAVYIFMQNTGEDGAAVSKTLTSGLAVPGISANARVNQEMHPVSVVLFVAVLVLQFVSLVLAKAVIHKIKSASDTAEVKLKKLENADIFMDLPLYIGLFGTVSSFIIIAFNPQVGRLIAYSSTLIGIILSVLLRITLLFPFRQGLIAEASLSPEGKGKDTVPAVSEGTA